MAKETTKVPPIPVGRGAHEQVLLPHMANRHGLIAGATGTGKTVTLKVLAEGFSNLGVPVFVADVKGDIAGLAKPGSMSPKLEERLHTLGIPDFEFTGFPVTLWDIFGKSGHPIRTSVSEMGPLLLSRLLGLNDTQSGVLTLTFTIADDNGLLLLDLKDLRSMLVWVADNQAKFRTTYGNVSTQSIGAIQRRLLELERQGAKKLFGEPVLDLEDFRRVDKDGRGYINILAADKLINSPIVYSTFLLYLLSELWEQLPELGDPEKPEIIFFFDEAHLLFEDAPKPLLDKVEQVARLIRSKGVGVYFVTQVPDDIPDGVLGQLGNKIQHALRAYTPRDQKSIRAAAQSFRPNPKLDTVAAIRDVGVGEAVVSLLDHKGRPMMVDSTLIRPPQSQFGALKSGERKALIAGSPIHGKYETLLDRESAFEMLTKRAEEAAAVAQLEAERAARRKEWSKTVKTKAPSRRRGKSEVQKAIESFTGSAIKTVGRELLRGILGSFRGR